MLFNQGKVSLKCVCKLAVHTNHKYLTQIWANCTYWKTYWRNYIHVSVCCTNIVNQFIYWRLITESRSPVFELPGTIWGLHGSRDRRACWTSVDATLCQWPLGDHKTPHGHHKWSSRPILDQRWDCDKCCFYFMFSSRIHFLRSARSACGPRAARCLPCTWA